MKNSISIFLVITFILAACTSTPQATMTPEATVTSTPLPTETPIPTPTLHPQFVALQEQIAASGGRFTLNPDGTIFDGSEPIPGLEVAPDGTMALTVDGEPMPLDPKLAVFDDENGFSYPGYSQNPDGSWVALKTYTKEQLEAMTPEQLVAEAPIYQGMTASAYIGYNEVIYLDENSSMTKVWDARTGEIIEIPDYLQKITPTDIKRKVESSYKELLQVNIDDVDVLSIIIRYWVETGKIERVPTNAKPYPAKPMTDKDTERFEYIGYGEAIQPLFSNSNVWIKVLGGVVINDVNGKPLMLSRPTYFQGGNGVGVMMRSSMWSQRYEDAQKLNLALASIIAAPYNATPFRLLEGEVTLIGSG